MENYSEARGLIFNIVHGSFVDGHGIRTTIFLKGCPLRCVWCCNPEGQKFNPQLKLTASHCNGCGRCVDACPQNAISIIDNCVSVDRSLCDNCGKCVEKCWFDALGMFGQWYTAAEMFEIVRKDKPFYDSSGGGLTIGGGEATWYPEFCLGLIELCHNAGISVAIDTCGYVDTELGLEVLKKADLLLFDIKSLDDEIHKRNTGVSNGLILRNLKMLSDMGKSIIIRIPVIPGYNDSETGLREIADLLRGLKSIERVDLIAFHEFGKVKYDQLGMEYKVVASPIPDKRQQELKELFESYGLKTQLGG
ncbi:MAG: glycyl-radical enzyme activating protein [Oscillospiraceae bacterium]|jgi:pyruvate formate lyase activating enzyme